MADPVVNDKRYSQARSYKRFPLFSLRWTRLLDFTSASFLRELDEDMAGRRLVKLFRKIMRLSYYRPTFWVNLLFCWIIF